MYVGTYLFGQIYFLWIFLFGDIWEIEFNTDNELQ